MSKCYKIQVKTLADVDKTLETLFGFGFVFRKECRINNLKELKAECSDMERGEWGWIIHGYDTDCQMVFGVSRAFDWTILNYLSISLDEFLEIKCCCPLAWAEMKKTTDIHFIPKNVEGIPIPLPKTIYYGF